MDETTSLKKEFKPETIFKSCTDENIALINAEMANLSMNVRKMREECEKRINKALK